MYRPTTRQVPLWGVQSGLPAEARERLAATWAGVFQDRVLPVLLAHEGSFSKLYRSGTGRPNWSVARRVGICLLQEMFDLPDQRALDAFSFDVRWQFALGVEPREAYLSRRSLVDFRSRLVREDPEMTLMRGVFDALRDAQVGDLKLSVELQRMDSTFVMSNIRKRGRVGLFSDTLGTFLRDLRKDRGESVLELSVNLQEWASANAKPSGWFGNGGSAPLLQKLAEWLVEVWLHFKHDDDVSSWESYELVARLVEEQLRLVRADDDAGGTSGTGSGTADDAEDVGSNTDGVDAHDPVEVIVRRKPERCGTSLQTPFDPDAAYGHKGVGYSVHVVETCHNEGVPEVITDFEVTGANQSDWGKTTPALDRLQKGGHVPEVMFVDGGYPSGPALLEAYERGVDLHGPVPRLRLPRDTIGREAFRFDEAGKVARCPQGHAPIRRGKRTIEHADGPAPFVYFDRKTCAECPIVERCITRASRTSHRRLEDRPSLRARDEALERQRSHAWWETYAIRSGIEATNSELKREHGLRRLRVRRKSKVRLAVTTKITACNIKRWMKTRIRAAKSA